MSSKIEVNVTDSGVQFGNAWLSHESITGYTAEQLNSGDCHVTGREYMKWLASITAPVVERQPVAEVIAAGGPHDREDRVLCELQAELPPIGTKLYTAPPELAELQATIARLTAENERLEREAKNDLIAYKAAIEKQDELRAEIERLSTEALPDRHEDWMAGAEAGRSEIERLKGGQGEPVAWLLDVEGYKTVIYDNYQKVLAEQEHFQGRGRTAVIRNLYTSQPAPVSAVNLRNFSNSMIDIALEGGNADGIQIQELAVEHGLLKPEQRTERCGDTCSCAEYADFPVECFRKVKELNQ